MRLLDRPSSSAARAGKLKHGLIAHLPSVEMMRFQIAEVIKQVIGIGRVLAMRRRDRDRRRWASPLQHIIQILARMPAAEIELDLSARHVLLSTMSGPFQSPYFLSR
jgi:hypothetical protein